MSSNQELIDRLTDEYRWMSTTTTTEEIRSFVENVIEETKKHIAKKLVESRKGMFELLIDQGFIDASDSSEEVEELVLAALEKL
jgi:DNA-binding phage protein